MTLIVPTGGNGGYFKHFPRLHNDGRQQVSGDPRMSLVWGEDYYGRVHRRAGVVCVMTRFFHINYFPVWPIQSYIMVDHGHADAMAEQGRFDTRRRQGLPWSLTPRSGWSVFCAYFWAVCAVTAGLGVAGLIATLFHEDPEIRHASALQFVLGFFIVASGLAYWLTRIMTQATDAKTEELLAEFGIIPDEG
jgi:hypothetical protein